MLIDGGCHCGNISFKLDWGSDPGEIPARACDCSFCIKHGGVWTSSPGGGLEVSVRNPSQRRRYEFGTKTAQFHVCTRCGVVPLATSEIDGRTYAVVSVNAMVGVDPALFRRVGTSFGAEDVAGRRARRARNWTPLLRFTRGADDTREAT